MSALPKLWKEFRLALDESGTHAAERRCLVLEEKAQALGGWLQLELLTEKAQGNTLTYASEKAAKQLLEKALHMRSGVKYQYTPLPLNAPYFRYLLLEPAEDPEAELICSVHVASLNDAPHFEAIS